jgi:DNA-binding transcriptional MocR family regulator
MAILKAGNEHLYLQIANRIEQQIMQEVLNIGDKLPSVRGLSIHHDVSMTTVLQAYYHLEGKGLIESRPKSGYYVRFNPNRFPDRPGKSDLSQASCTKDVDSIISEVYDDWNDTRVTRFSISVPAAEMLPLAALNKATIQALRELPANGTSYEPVQGNALLRRQIARWSLNWEGSLGEEDMITTAGCMNAISYCLMSLTKRGDTVAVESPAYFGTLRLLKSLGLNVVELPTDPDTGVDPDDVKNALVRHDIKALLLVTNFSNPLGFCIPDEQKKELVTLLASKGVPLIEDDLYGDVYFGKKRPKSCKSFDEEGNVLWCGSISKTLAPGYRVGWVAPGKYYQQVKRSKLYHSITSATVQQTAIANFLATGRYEHHLRKLRSTLHANCLQYMRAIGDYFPAETKVSHPAGGFILWVELPVQIDTYKLYQEAILHRISIAPGAMFSLQQRYQNCMRLSYGLPWNNELEKTLKKLGSIAKGMV